MSSRENVVHQAVPLVDKLAGRDDVSEYEKGNFCRGERECVRGFSNFGITRLNSTKMELD